ncbi:hypothetical protein JXA88_13520 [Candidatus Fermentibacteria bacterium]|nr:hypothetical protein [Candidatus Fermentibacteria bacterium]
MGQGGRLSSPSGAGGLRFWGRCPLPIAWALISLGAAAFCGAAHARHVQARIETTDPLPVTSGIDVIGRKGDICWIVTDPATLHRLRGSGYAVHVEIEDLEARYAAGIRGPAWGIYHTLAEAKALLDSVHAACPAITAAPFSLGTSHEGRPIWALKISDNPHLDEDEPEILIDGLHHAREVMSVETILDFARLLCSGYDDDPEIRAVVDQRQIFLVPVVNPDGMVYNEQVNPQGGGMWRKNRRDNGNGTFGVDLNRNYSYEWGRDDGSSADPASNVYRGPAPSSEPETQAIIAFMVSRRLVTHLSMHSFLGAALIPWGYTSAPAPDDDLLRTWARRLSADNGYAVAQPAEVLYLCSGMTTDYAYGDTEAKNRIISSTIEIGGSGFWPAEHEVPALIEECRAPLLHASQSAGIWLAVADWGIGGGNGDGRIDPGETIRVTFAMENRAVTASASPGTISLTTDDAYVLLHTPGAAIPGLAAQDTVQCSDIVFSVDDSAPQGHIITMIVRAHTSGFVGEERVRFRVGRPPALFFDDFEGDLGAWVPEGSWGLTVEDANSPVTSLTDSPGASYENYADSAVRLAHAVDLSSVPGAELSFWHRYSTEEGYDHCIVEASGDGGAAWRQLGPQYSGSAPWRQVAHGLDQFQGSTSFLLRFRLETDVSITADGWHIDDVQIAGPTPGNTPPGPPTPLNPPDGSLVVLPVLSVAVSPDPDGDSLTCGFFLYGDSLLTMLIAASGEIQVADGAGSWSPQLPGQGVFWWRAFAFDGTERGLLSPAWRFGVGLGPSEEADFLPTYLATFPLPSHGRTVLGFHLAHPSEATLTIHDLAGHLVATPADADFPAGLHRTIWDGLTDDGTRCGPGVYLARLSTPSLVTTRVLVLID